MRGSKGGREGEREAERERGMVVYICPAMVPMDCPFKSTTLVAFFFNQSFSA